MMRITQIPSLGFKQSRFKGVDIRKEWGQDKITIRILQGEPSDVQIAPDRSITFWDGSLKQDEVYVGHTSLDTQDGRTRSQAAATLSQSVGTTFYMEDEELKGHLRQVILDSTLPEAEKPQFIRMINEADLDDALNAEHFMDPDEPSLSYEFAKGKVPYYPLA